MVMKEEQLLSEDRPGEGETRVRLVMAVSHSIPRVGDFSLFGGDFEEAETPVFYPAGGMVTDGVRPGEEMLVSEYGGGEPVIVGNDAPADSGMERFRRMFESLLKEEETVAECQCSDERAGQITDCDAPEKPEKYIIRCDGVMSRRGRDIVIAYDEDNGEMGETRSEIVLHGGRRDLVSIIRTGALTNTLVCEQGQRHISAYTTPVMPFQVCVFAKECSHDVSLVTGGSILLNYYVELRGTEMQHTKMRISVHVI